MKQKIYLLLKEPLIRKLLKIFLGVMLVFISVLILKWNRFPPQIPLFYSLPRSQNQLGSQLQILFLPLLTIIFFAFNFLIAVFIYSRLKLAAMLLVITGTILSFLLCITFLRIVFLI